MGVVIFHCCVQFYLRLTAPLLNVPNGSEIPVVWVSKNESLCSCSKAIKSAKDTILEREMQIIKPSNCQVLHVISLDDIGIHRQRQLFIIHVHKQQRSSWESFLHNKRSFIVRGPFSSVILLNLLHFLQNKIPFAELTRAHSSVKSFFHSALI